MLKDRYGRSLETFMWAYILIAQKNYFRQSFNENEINSTLVTRCLTRCVMMKTVIVL